MNGFDSHENIRRVLGRVTRQDFVGRAAELERITLHATAAKRGRGLLLLMAPSAGVSELLRQVYDDLFNRHSDVIPIYFAFSRNETTAVSAAIEFLQAFLQQYLAFRRNEPALCHAALTLEDVVELAPLSDREWIEQLVQLYARVRFSNDNKELVRFCLGAPQRIPGRVGRAFVMLDGAQLAEDLNGSVVLGTELLRVFGRSGLSFVLAGLRRQILNAARAAEANFELLDLLRLEQLSTEEAQSLVDHVSIRQHVATSREVRDLLVEQFSGSPLFFTNFLHAAREKNVSLVSYLDCERLYVDELLGGYIHHYFQNLLEEMTPQLDKRLELMRLLWEAATTDDKSVSVESWRKSMHLNLEQLEDILHHLHIHEFVNWTGAIVDSTTGLQTWKDYLKANYRLTVSNQPRALVVAEAITDSLKRAPHTMARHYKRLGRIDLREVLRAFDCQRVPAVLLDYADFSRKYKGVSDAELQSVLAAESDLLKLPQTVHAASLLAFNNEMRQVCDEDKCVVAHTFVDGTYTDAQETTWLVAEIESKLEVEADLASLWHERLEAWARIQGFRQYQIWLIATEGFSDAACEEVRRRQAYCSSKRQLDVLVEQIGAHRPLQPLPLPDADEFLVVVPMGEENELIAASTVEQIARRLTFPAPAINQIKTAIVEACINASEHSHSPDRKIYQRFRVESDKLVVTISSRGILPTNVGSGNAIISKTADDEAAEERRGWGLKLIRSLMDEVEFERVDEGTSLRMTKYLRKSSA
jgi:serine/threonine-protein kinase RsbW